MYRRSIPGAVMTLDLLTQDLRIGIVDAGAMGRGIAPIAAQAGYRVRLFVATTHEAMSGRIPPTDAIRMNPVTTV